MQKLKYLFMLSLLVLGISCVDESNKHCPNVMLDFVYTADEGNNVNVLDKYIQTAQLFIYDQNDLLIRSLSLEDIDLKNGLLLKLPIGTYRAVCWGNADKNTSITEANKISDGLVNAVGLDTHTIETNDPLYWGAIDFPIEICDGPENKHTIVFESAHINLDIRISGNNPEFAKVEVHNLMPQYNFNKENNLPFSETYSPQLIPFGEENMLQAYLHVLRFNTVNPVKIVVNFQDGSKPLVIPIQHFLETYHPGVILENKAEVNIVIEIFFDELEVHVTIPGWEIKNPNIGV